MQLVIITILFLPGPDGYGHPTGILCFPPNIPPDADYCFCNNSAYPRYGKDFITGCAHTSHKTKGGGTTGARGALAPLKFAEGGLSPPYVMAL